jgi:DNA-directed RNA polymerase alpha subunit
MQTRREPKIEITKCDPTKTIFVLSDSDVSFANALRRVMISEVGGDGASWARVQLQRQGDCSVPAGRGQHA